MSISELTELIRFHLNKNNLNYDPSIWRIDLSSVEGRGIIANRDISAGEIIFIDKPLIIGPRAGVTVKIHCVICSKFDHLKPCSCGLPICEQCEYLDTHKTECDFIKSNSEKLTDISLNLFRGLTPLRALFLDEKSRELLKSLYSHKGSHGFEVQLIKQHIKILDADEKFMYLVCSVLDSNAFETGVSNENKIASLKGLYPLSSLLNHNCSPNTTHLFDNQQNMIVKASVFIPKNTEIFTTYSKLLWSTLTRRYYLHKTKFFHCSCTRCIDPTEFNTGLNALKCTQDNCNGFLLPINVLLNTTQWKCNACQSLCSYKTISKLQTIFAGLIKSLENANVEKLINLIKNELINVVPLTNHIVTELKFRVIWLLGSSEKYFWNELSLDQLNLKEEFCNDVLVLISKLQLGQCRLRGLMLYELFLCKEEKKRRNLNVEIEEIRNISKEVLKILENDIEAPKIAK